MLLELLARWLPLTATQHATTLHDLSFSRTPPQKRNGEPAGHPDSTAGGGWTATHAWLLVPAVWPPHCVLYSKQGCCCHTLLAPSLPAAGRGLQAAPAASLAAPGGAGAGTPVSVSAALSVAACTDDPQDTVQHSSWAAGGKEAGAYPLNEHVEPVGGGVCWWRAGHCLMITVWRVNTALGQHRELGGGAEDSIS